MKNEILIFRPNELLEHIEVRIEDEQVWLNTISILKLFLLPTFQKDNGVLVKQISYICPSDSIK